MKINDDGTDEIREAWGRNKGNKCIDTSVTTKELYENIEKFEHMQNLKPLILSMKMFGLYHSTVFKMSTSRSSDTSDGDELHGKESPTRSWSPSRVYSLVVSFILLLNTGRMLTMFRKDVELGAFLYMRILVFAWIIACTAQSFLCYLAFGRSDRMLALLKSDDDLPLEELNIPRCPKYLKKRAVIYTVIAWICIIFNVCYYGYEIFIHKSQDAILLTPYEPKETNEMSDVVIRLTFFIIYMYLSAAWTLPSVFYFIACLSVWLRFKHFNNVITQAITHDKRINETLESFRQCHLRICACTEHASKMFSVYNTVNIMVYSCNSILILYVILWYTADTFSRIVQAFWVISCLVTLGVIAMGGGMLNQEAHESLDVLHSVKYSKDDRFFEYSMTMFLSKLKVSPIGLSVSGIFVIDKSFVFSIVGILVTYFILLVQFKPSDVNIPNGICNCTETICS
ncbi:unnamed protein product [Owenia fusiformis]|uniref:Uncharacterized protein n=1 Tax=Owenia fusiformis TaxID=6347 RepID=A0A8J1TS15_OWEFU|nr:unnamed protein product [Owenia fusiformis]